ncbi:MAG: hypothetical protein LBL90_06935 [Prevotellaceae bacterium]|jgi:hypothetical protein|nr:hypothetical protein [Prevotellaceae bacterium]
MKVAAILAKTWTKRPAVERTLFACCKLLFTFSQLKIDSTGCLIEDTSQDNKSLAAFSRCWITSGQPLTSFTGVSMW